MAINDVLREARKEVGYSIDYMAKALGYKSKVSYHNIENEIVEVTLKQAMEISRLLNKPIQKLFPKFFVKKVQENQTGCSQAS